MDFDITRPGLYYLLNTPAVQTRIRELGIASRVCFEKGEPDEIIRLVSQAVAEVVQQELSTQLERLESVDSEALKRPEWIEEIVKGVCRFQTRYLRKSRLTKTLQIRHAPIRNLYGLRL